MSGNLQQINLSQKQSSSFQNCVCRPRILIVDDNEYNMMPLKYFINDVKFDHDSIRKITMKLLNPEANLEARASSSEGIQIVQDLNLRGHQLLSSYHSSAKEPKVMLKILGEGNQQRNSNIESFSNFNNEDIMLDENASNISEDRIQIDEAING